MTTTDHMQKYRDQALEAIILGILITLVTVIGTPFCGKALSSFNHEPTLKVLRESSESNLALSR